MIALIRIVIIALTIITAVVQSDVSAQSTRGARRRSQENEQPSLQETLRWLEAKVAAHPSLVLETADGKYYQTSQKLEFKGCYMVYTESTFNKDSMHLPAQSTTATTASLSDFSHVDVTLLEVPRDPYPKHYMVQLFTPNFEKTIKSVNTATSGRASHTHEFRAGVVLIHFDLREKALAERVAKAFSHAINLCRSSYKEPF